MILGTDIAPYLAGPFLGACGLLAVAGAGKVLRPVPALAAVRAVGLRLPRPVVIVFGAGEIAAALVGAMFGGRTALAVAACYLVLTVFALGLRRRAPATPCACLGSSSAVVTRLHVVVNVAAIGVALIAASGGPPLAQVSGRPLAGAVFVVLVACCVKLAALALEALPELTTVTREGTT